MRNIRGMMRSVFESWVIWRSGEFDKAYYLAHNVDVAMAGVPAIWHFVRSGANEQRNPSENFDVKEYLSLYQDVRASGLNPLFHYIRYGKAEGRYKHRKKTGKLSQEILSSSDGSILILTHGSGGGAEKYIFRSLLSPEKGISKAILVRPENNCSGMNVRVRIASETAEEARYPDWESLSKDINPIHFSAIVVNNLVFWPSTRQVLNWISAYKAENTGVRVEFKGHDFFSICPSYTLMDMGQKYCGVRCDEEACAECVKMQGTQHLYLDRDSVPLFSISHWRQMWKSFFMDTADTVEVYSPSSREIFLQAYPEIEPKIKLHPHRVSPFESCHIAVIGHLLVQKGAEVVAAFCQYLDENQIEDMQVYLFGSNSNGIASPHLTEMGIYERDSLPDLLRKARIDVVFIPSVCPETFCYTAGESIALGYPTACFNIGGQADQVRQYEKGILLSRTDAGYLYESFRPFASPSKGLASSNEEGRGEQGTERTVVVQDKETVRYLDYLFKLRADKSRFVPEAPDSIVMTGNMPKVIAFYLPQFHDFPENVKWFGRGFSEWTNTSQTVPQFVGHLQPHVPIDVGYYNLDTTGVMHRQAELAKKYGISGFCVYYYWFSGQKLMENPMKRLLQDPSLDFPFFFFWADENWTRLWGDGGERETLYKTEILPGDAEKFMEDLYPYMSDSRYIRIRNKPALIIYKLHNHPKEDLLRFIRSIRRIAEEKGLNGLYLSGIVEEWMDRDRLDEYQKEYELDAITEFSSVSGRELHVSQPTYVDANCRSYCFDVPEYIANKRYLYETKANVFKGLFTNWDNSPRRYSRGASILQNTPEDYKRWLVDLIADTRKHHPSDEQLIFVNAWNEWAECAHLEPDTHFGYAYLQKTREALEESSGQNRD